MLERVAYLAEFGESESVRLKAAENYDKLLQRHQAHERTERCAGGTGGVSGGN